MRVNPLFIFGNCSRILNTVQNMNSPTEDAVVAAAVSALNALGVRASARVSTNADAVVKVRHAGRVVQYVAEVRRHLTPALVGPIAVRFTGPRGKRLLLTDYVTPPIAEALRQAGVEFADAAGNSYLQKEGLFILVTGRPRKVEALPSNTLRLFRPSGLRVLFVLISTPQGAAASHRAIAGAAGVSLGSVTPVLEGLRELGFLTDLNGTRRLVDRSRLIDQWTEGYARRLQPKLEMGRFRADDEWWQHADLAPYGALWGGETAAALLQRHIRPQQAIVYVEQVPARMLNQYRMKPDGDGNVIFRRRFWNAVPSPRTDLTPPLLIYADLVATGDARSLAAAKELRKEYLD